MKKRIFMIMLAVMIAVTFMPATSFGVSSVGSYNGEKQNVTIIVPDKPGQSIYVRHNPLRSQVRHNEDLLEQVKQLLREEKIAAMEGIEGEESHYCQEILDDITALSNEFDQKVEAAESIDDLCDIIMGYLVLKDDLYQPLADIQKLSRLTKQQVTSASDLTRMKKELKSDVTTHFNKYKKADYTEYYWGILTTKKSEVLKSVEDIKNFRDYVRTESAISEEGFSAKQLDDEDEWERVNIRNLRDIDDDGEEGTDDFYESCWLYDKYEVASNKAMFQGWADTLVSEEMKELGYENAAEEFADLVEKTKKQIDSEVDCDVMYLDYVKLEDKVYKAAMEVIEEKEPVSVGDILRLQKKMGDIFMNYKMSNYSDKNWKKLKGIYDLYLEKADNIFYQDQLDNSLLDKMKAKMDKVPDLKTELKNLKTKRIKQIKKYAKNKKFNQKKSIPLANKAVKKIKAAKTTAQVDKIYKTYKSKIAKTAKKKTSKKKKK